jgi:hypothetical protein
MSGHYHARQFDGSPVYCDGRNCAAASGAMAVAYATNGAKRPSADDFRRVSGKSCTPGVDSRSGGLTINAVAATCAKYGVSIDYGADPNIALKRWTATELKTRIRGQYGAVLLGDYDQIPAKYDAQPGFAGDHSVWVHDGTSYSVCWHDPLRSAHIRVPWTVVIAYNQKAGSPVKGLAGFVRIPLPDTSTEDDLDLYSVPGNVDARVVSGAALYKSPGVKSGTTITDGTKRYALVAQDERDTPNYYCIDGGGEGLMRWVRAADIRDKRSFTGSRPYDVKVTVGGKSVTGTVTLP